MQFKLKQKLTMEGLPTKLLFGLFFVFLLLKQTKLSLLYLPAFPAKGETFYRIDNAADVEINLISENEVNGEFFDGAAYDEAEIAKRLDL